MQRLGIPYTVSGLVQCLKLSSICLYQPTHIAWKQASLILSEFMAAVLNHSPQLISYSFLPFPQSALMSDLVIHFSLLPPCLTLGTSTWYTSPTWTFLESSLASYQLCDPMDCSPPGSLSMGFSRQEYWSELPFPSPGESSQTRDRTLVLLHCRQILSEPPGKLWLTLGQLSDSLLD